ncbi:MBL fold metallo-hydrolase [Phenylobacterium sp.]|jgi:7,8-dihydropterin-6-yl-methyl-4-(beta-D-ribofuranosyl)aminobenzene 5'-phosphate synthase|uniref:MBL fold metallo-hydrolase n=1 Tax=Phenylobacterium sp. TaxID=1871053 RepID=UPI002F9329BA
MCVVKLARFLGAAIVALGWSLTLVAAGPAKAASVASLKVTVLSTMITDLQGVGEWGYAALVEVDGRRILFDTGARPDVVLANARELRVDLSDVDDVVLSHNHADHTGGLLSLRKSVMARRQEALGRVHVAKAFFDPWRAPNPIHRQRPELESLGVRFVQHNSAVQLAPGIWLTGPVPRHTDEQNYSRGLLADGAPAPDVPDDQALIIETRDGLVVITGCGHAGIVNIVDYARQITGVRRVTAIIGGLHLFEATHERLDWTAARLRKAGVRYLLAGHCTGLEATYRLRAAMRLDRVAAVYGAVGATFEAGKGIDGRPIAR